MVDVVYHRLKRELIELKRLPGEVLKEKELAADLGMSKTPVREALARLHRDRLVRAVPRWGYVVTPVTLTDALELCHMRTVLQTEAAGCTARRGLPGAHARRLEELCVDVAGEDLGGPGLEPRLRLNYEFEAIIANGSGNGRLARQVVHVFDEFERVARLALRLDPHLPPGRLEERRSLVAALIRGDEMEARDAMRARTTSAQREVISALQTSESIAAAAISVPNQPA